ncbi:hypothetical protein BKA66DRAFT_463009 [Pyrenochaeta sp. MPI-SDFR-AT-0127]|nr:hypothetical protein BKA66DRAFT_463009 [Pyrenochaeta sp. MPI-SDFR-AT-0127]
MPEPLTTTFTPPAGCTSDVWDGEGYYILGGTRHSTCMPTAFKPDAEPSFFYSPGLYCPAGYSTACSSSTAIGSETETVITCCPSRYKCQERTRSAWDWESTLGCTSACLTEQPITILLVSSIHTTVCAVGGGVNAYSVQLRYRAADLQITSSSISLSTTPATNSLPTATSTSVSTSTFPAQT